jgi:hypothetical protein
MIFAVYFYEPIKIKLDNMANIKNYVVSKDSITISKQELERLIECYSERVNEYSNLNPMSPTSWITGLYQGKREMCYELLHLIK